MKKHFHNIFTLHKIYNWSDYTCSLFVFLLLDSTLTVFFEAAIFRENALFKMQHRKFFLISDILSVQVHAWTLQ